MKFFLSYIRPSRKGYDLTYVAINKKNQTRVAYTLTDIIENVIRCEIGSEPMSYFLGRKADHTEMSVPLTERAIRTFSKASSGFSGRRI